MEKQKINISELTLDEKIGQLIIINGIKFNNKLAKLNISGVFISNNRLKIKSKKELINTIKKWNKSLKIKPSISGDVEGYWNPLKKFYKGKTFGEIKNENEAFELGKEHGKVLKDLGFTINFSPICELENKVWPGRNFKGSVEEVKNKITNYIKGIQDEKIQATAKHYPGGSLVKDPHKISYKIKISKEDLSLFDSAIKADVEAIMVGHPIVYGAIDSENKPSTISKKVISNLRKDFKGIIITDAISMKGLSSKYKYRLHKTYPDLIKAGNDIVLDSIAPKKGYHRRIRKGIEEIKSAVIKGEISKNQINESVKRILKLKGYLVEN
ncbi:hypothetical protein CMI38_01535 [Candidatus Pacearchaeota archaeon]|nr:hypothetical protein [Candidatus Pacearchaeota archaeon]|tara:strand:+ start:653 stop:1630 length:978 start_codon:yes stop_codon:yes gene_type:complete